MVVVPPYYIYTPKNGVCTYLKKRCLRIEHELALPRIVDEYCHEEGYYAFRYHVMQVDVLMTVDKLGERYGASRIEHPADAPDDEISPCHAFLLALRVAEHIAVVEAAVGDSTTHHAQCIGQSVVYPDDVGQQESQSKIYDGCYRGRELSLAKSEDFMLYLSHFLLWKTFIYETRAKTILMVTMTMAA